MSEEIAAFLIIHMFGSILANDQLLFLIRLGVLPIWCFSIYLRYFEEAVTPFEFL